MPDWELTFVRLIKSTFARRRDRSPYLEKYALNEVDWLIESLGARLLHYTKSEVMLKQL